MTRYDIIIVGAGITGVGIFERAARKGLRVLLVERGRPGGATTAATSRLLHGGLRYLPYDLVTSLTMCGEAGRLSREYADLVCRQVFLWPVYRGHRVGLETVQALLGYYDRFRAGRGGREHVRLSASEAREVEPRLEAGGLKGALAFDEWRVDVGGLVRALVRGGESAGGEVLLGARAVSFARAGRTLRAVRVREEGGRETEREAKVYVNAGGPWAEEIAGLAGCSGARLTLRKGVQLVLRGERFPVGLIFPGPDGRHIGLYPGADETRVGPTDDPYAGSPDDASPSEREREDLAEALGRVMPGARSAGAGMTIGLRPLFRQGGLSFLMSRDFRVHDHADEGTDNLVSVIGGKLTTFRPMADAALRGVEAKLGRSFPEAGAEGSAVPGALRRLPGALQAAASGGLFAAACLRHAGRRLSGGYCRGLAEFERVYGDAR